MKKSKVMLYIIAMMSFIGTLILYPRLPDRIPTHYNFRWEVDAYGPKYVAIILGILPIVFCVLMDVIPHIDPKRKNHNISDKTYSKFSWILVILFVVLNWANLLMVQGVAINGRFYLSLLMGVSFLAIGNYLPKVKPNYFLGIKTPWTLANDVVWRKTHRVGGYVFILFGVGTFISYVIASAYFEYILMVGLFVGVGYLFIYSYLIFREESKKKSND